MALAIFDLDNTLIAGDSDHSWGQFLVETGRVDADAYKDANDQFYRDYENGALDINAYLRFSLEPLTHYSLETLRELHSEFTSAKIDALQLPKAQELLAKHREAGDFILIITSTNDFITRPIAEALGVDDILATTAEIIDDKYTGDIVGTPCYQDGKIVRLQQWLENNPHDLTGAYFYSDSINDLPLLADVDKPICVDPDAALLTEANTRDWPVISLR